MASRGPPTCEVNHAGVAFHTDCIQPVLPAVPFHSITLRKTRDPAAYRRPLGDRREAHPLCTTSQHRHNRSRNRRGEMSSISTVLWTLRAAQTVCPPAPIPDLLLPFTLPVTNFKFASFFESTRGRPFVMIRHIRSARRSTRVVWLKQAHFDALWLGTWVSAPPTPRQPPRSWTSNYHGISIGSRSAKRRVSRLART